MERLTIEKCGDLLIKNNDNEYRSPCFGCESINKCNPEKMPCGFYKALEKLKEYEDLEEQGKLTKLPCAVGDTVYEINRMRNTVSEFLVKGFSISEYGIFVKWVLVNGIYNNLSGVNDSEIGKTVFLTQEKAEDSLKGVGKHGANDTKRCD